MTAPDLTAQLAESVRAAWDWKHHASCGRIECSGVAPDCRYPKPAALVAYEQAQQFHSEMSRLAKEVAAKEPGLGYVTAVEVNLHAVALPNPDCACATCNDLRADGAGESEPPESARRWKAQQDAGFIAPSEHSVAYVLTRTPLESAVDEILRVYPSERAAGVAKALCAEVDPTSSYRVHAVPRVE